MTARDIPKTENALRPQREARGQPLRLLVATSNDHKVEEISARLGALGGGAVTVRGSRGLPDAAAPEETGASFLENARIKALACAERARLLPRDERPDWVVADDSGLEVDALGGAPGVLSARFAGPGATDSENNRKLLDALSGLPAGERGASFACVLVAVPIEGPRSAAEVHVEGRTRGRILDAPRGRGGFGYDPLFLVPDLGKTYAELSPGEKNDTSHRGKALLRLWERIGSARPEGEGPP
jgi:XTP/dITP diphosphohydrolase